MRKVNLEIPFKAFAPDDILRPTSASGEKILVDFRGANLSGANLTAANFAFSNFENANLEGANLYHACLCGANLIGANFTNSNLIGVDFDNAKMDSDIFRKARNANNMAMELHNMAMGHAEKALLAKRAGDIDEYQKIIRMAYEFDREAAGAISLKIGFEPTRSVLYRSAATLAFDCGEYLEALELASVGLIGDNIPAEIKEELIDLRNKIKQNIKEDTK